MHLFITLLIFALTVVQSILLMGTLLFLFCGIKTCRYAGFKKYGCAYLAVSGLKLLLEFLQAMTEVWQNG